MARTALPFVVECKSTQKFFEPIAAFNCRPAAEAYMEACRHPLFEYRLKELKRVRQAQVDGDLRRAARKALGRLMETSYADANGVLIKQLSAALGRV